MLIIRVLIMMIIFLVINDMIFLIIVGMFDDGFFLGGVDHQNVFNLRHDELHLLHSVHQRHPSKFRYYFNCSIL